MGVGDALGVGVGVALDVGVGDGVGGVLFMQPASSVRDAIRAQPSILVRLVMPNLLELHKRVCPG